MIGGNFCLSQYLKNTNLELVESQLSFSNYILSKCNSTDYSTDSLTLALHRNDDKYRQFCKYFSSKYDPIFFNNLTYSYKRISYLIDEKLEVIYWADKYNVYLRGIRNRIKQERNENIDLLASNKEDFDVSKQSVSLIKSDYTKNNIKSEAVYLNGEWIEESTSSVFSENRTAEYEAQRIRDQEKKEAVIVRQIEAQRISDSLKELEQLAKFEEQRLAKESAERLLAEELKRQQISDSLAKAEQLAEFEAQRLAEESSERLLAEELKRQQISDSLAKAEQLAEFDAQRLAEESSERLLAEELKRQQISDSLAKAEQLAEFEAQRLAEESSERLLAEELKRQQILDSIAKAEQLAELAQQRKEEEARLLAEQIENKRISDSIAKAEQLAELAQQRKEEEARLLAEQVENKRISDSIAKAEQLAKLEQQRKEEEARLLAEQIENKRISDSISKAEQLAELAQQRKEEEARWLAEQIENKRISDSIAKAEHLAKLEQQREEEEARLLAEKQLIHGQNKHVFTEKETNSDANLSEMYTAPKVKYDEYYTIKLTTVYSPMEGISFLNNIRDGDEIWRENAFHLYQDEYNSNLTNISIGKFSSLDEADIVINKLKNKGLTSAKAIRYTNKMKLNSAANSIKKKSDSKPVVKTTVVKPTEKKTVNNTPKSSNNRISENKIINTSSELSENIKNSSVKEENKSTEKKDIKTENAFSNISKEVNKDQDFFTVQLAAVSEITSERINSINLDKKQLFYQNINAGKYALNYKKFSNYGEAHKKAIELHNQGFEGVYVAKYVNNKRTTVSKSDLKNDNVSESTIDADLRSLGYRPLDFNRNGKYIQIGSFYNWDSHSYEDSYEFINHTIYYMIDQSHIVKFLIGPFNDRDLFIELRNVKKQINDAFIKNI